MEYYNIVNEKYKKAAQQPIILPQIKVELLDWNENVIGEIQEDILTDSSSSISVNYQQGLWRSCSLTLDNSSGKYNPDPYNNIFWINSKFKIYVGLKDINNGDIYWFSQGVYLTTNPTVNKITKTVSISGVDKFGFLGSESGYNQLDGTYVIHADTNTYKALKDTLKLPLGNGYVIDPIEPRLDRRYNSEIMPYDLNKAPESYMGELFIEIANSLGCDIYYDTEGRLNVSGGTLDMFYEDKSAVWSFSDKYTEYLNDNSGTLSYNTTDVYNVVKVVGNNINDMTYTYTAKNYNPKSNTNIYLIGEKPIYVESSSVYNDDRAKDYAELKLRQNSIVQQSFEFESSLLPHIQPNEVIEITDEYYNFETQRFIVNSITIPLDFSGSMSISACNVAELPYWEYTPSTSSDI